MALVALSTSAAELVPASGRPQTVFVKNEDGSIVIRLGPSTVTNSGATAGIPVAAGATIGPIRLKPGANLYAIAASGTPNASYLTT